MFGLVERRTGDGRRDGPIRVITVSGADELGVHQAGGDCFCLAADDCQPFAIQQRPPKAFIEQLVDGVAVDLPLERAGVAEPVWFDADAVGHERRVRESLGDIPAVLHQPSGGVAAGFVEQRPEQFPVLGMQTGRQGQTVEPFAIDIR